MPQFAIQPDQIRRVTADRILGRQTTTGPAEELSSTDAKTLLGLGSSDSPTFAGLDVTNWLTIDGSNFLVETPSGTGSDARIRIDNGEPRVELYSYSGSTSPFLRMGGATPGSSVSTSIRHFETGGNHYLNIGDKDGSARWCFSHVGDEFFLSHSAGAIGWSGTYRQAYDASPDTTLFRDDANILALRNGVNAMASRVYNTFIDASNNEYGACWWDTNIFRVGTYSNGTGSGRDVYFQRNNSTYLHFDSSDIIAYRDILSNGNNNLGDSSGNHVGNIYASNLYNSSGGGRIQLGGSDTIFYQAIRMQGAADYLGFDQGGKLYGDGAGTTISQRNGTNAQSFRIYNTYTDASNYERSVFKYVSGDLWIDTEYAGTGSPNRNIYIGKNGSAEFLFGNGKNTTYQNFVPSATGSWRVGGTSERFFAGYWGGNTVTTSTPMLDLSQTWNDGAIEFTGILSNITNAASASTSKLIDLQVGGISKFKVSNAGMITTAAGNGSGTAGGLMLGNSIGWISRGTGSVELASGAAEYVEIASDGITLRTGNSFGWSSNNNPQDSAGPRFWENTSTETIELRRGATALGFAVANTWTDANNLEFGVFDWTTTSNVLTIGTVANGTGLDRDIELSPATGNVLVPATGKIAFSTRLTLNGSSRRLMTDNSQTLQLQGSSFTTSQTVSAVDIGGNFTDADGDQKVLSLTPTYNQTGTAGGTDILVNRIEQGVGSGEQNLLDLQVGGTSKFKVDNAGNAVMSGVVNQMTSSASLPSTTEFPNDQDWGIHHDTLNDHVYLAFNKSGSIKKTLIN